MLQRTATMNVPLHVRSKNQYNSHRASFIRRCGTLSDTTSRMSRLIDFKCSIPVETYGIKFLILLSQFGWNNSCCKTIPECLRRTSNFPIDMILPLFGKEGWREYLDGHFKKFTEHNYIIFSTKNCGSLHEFQVFHVTIFIVAICVRFGFFKFHPHWHSPRGTLWNLILSPSNCFKP